MIVKCNIMEETIRSRSDSGTVSMLNPHVEIMLRQANEMKHREDYTKAIEAYDQVLKIDPRHARALHSKGNVLDMLGRYEEAISCYDSALECDSLNAETWYNKGITLNKTGCKNESIKCILRGLSLSIGDL
jgi:tetratricopeptide (TPR) repeat protein